MALIRGLLAAAVVVAVVGLIVYKARSEELDEAMGIEPAAAD